MHLFTRRKLNTEKYTNNIEKSFKKFLSKHPTFNQNKKNTKFWLVYLERKGSKGRESLRESEWEKELGLGLGFGATNPRRELILRDEAEVETKLWAIILAKSLRVFCSQKQITKNTNIYIYGESEWERERVGEATKESLKKKKKERKRKLIERVKIESCESLYLFLSFFFFFFAILFPLRKQTQYQYRTIISSWIYDTAPHFFLGFSGPNTI